jgi:hypothetical protein
LAPYEAEEIERQLQQLLNVDHIQPKFSPCTFPAFIIPKKESGKWCLVTDYQALNKIIVKNRYPLPRIEDLLDHLKGEKYFTKMDLTARYHQVCMVATDTWKTSFKTIFGLYEWMVMHFGLTNAPTIDRLINDIVHPLLGGIVVIYLYDILVFIQTWEEHLQHVCTVLQLLCTNHLQVKECKSSFVQTFVSYLVFIIDQEGVCHDASKVQILAQ